MAPPTFSQNLCNHLTSIRGTWPTSNVLQVWGIWGDHCGVARGHPAQRPLYVSPPAPRPSSANSGPLGQGSAIKDRTWGSRGILRRLGNQSPSQGYWTLSCFVLLPGKLQPREALGDWRGSDAGGTGGEFQVAPISAAQGPPPRTRAPLSELSRRNQWGRDGVSWLRACIHPGVPLKGTEGSLSPGLDIGCWRRCGLVRVILGGAG